jgi:hypothetical protein
MRKALVGIAAALMLTTLVIAIVPAFAVTEYYFYDKTPYYYLWVDPTTHEFSLNYPGTTMCYGVGAIVVKGVLTIPYGKCTHTESYVSFLFGGGPVSVTKPIKLVVVFKPPGPTKPMTITLWYCPSCD